MNDYLQLAPINAMCKYIRNSIYKILDKIEREPDEDNQIIITEDELDSAVDQFLEIHNFKRKIKLYDETPALITRE